MKSELRTSISDLFQRSNDILKGRIRKFIARKYDILVEKLQFADNISNEFDSVDMIVDLICEKLSNAEDDDFKILIPLLIRQKMKDSLQIRDGEYFNKNDDLDPRLILILCPN